MAKGKKTGGRDFQPGQSGNPGGALALPDDVRQARALTARDIIEAATEILRMAPFQIVAMMADPNMPAYKLILASVIKECVQRGDILRFELILDRIIGPAPTKPLAPPQEKPVDLSGLSVEELEQLENLVEKTNGNE